MNTIPHAKNRLAQAVGASLALLAMTQAPAHAAACDAIISTDLVFGCDVAPGGSVTVNSGVSITVLAPGGMASPPWQGILVGDGAGTITNNGTITVSPGGSASGIRVTGGSIVTGGITNNGTISLASPVGGDKLIKLDNTTNPFVFTNTGTLNGNVDLGINTLNIDGTTSAIKGTVYGSGTGSVVNVNGLFNAPSAGGPGYTSFDVGTININPGGTLNVVNIGFSLRGGTGGVANNGTLGVPAGQTATIYGNYSQTGTGIFRTGVASNSSYGKLLLSSGGVATFPANARIDVDVVGSPALTAGTVLTEVVGVAYGSTLNASTFAVTDNSALFDFTAAKVGDSVNLTIAAASASSSSSSATSYVQAARNPASTGAAGIFDSLMNSPGGMGSIITALGQLPTGQQVSDAIRKTLPLMVTGVKSAGFTGSRNIDKIIQSRVEQSSGLSGGDDIASDRQLWVKPVGSLADQSDLKGVSGFKSRSYGLVVGADSVVSSKLRVGGAVSYTSSRVDSNSAVAPNTAKTDSYRLIGYGSYSLDSVTDVNFQADIATGKTEGKRFINFGGVTNADSSYRSNIVHLGAGLGRTYPWAAKTTITPSIRLDYTRISDGAYTETGAGPLNLAVNKNSAAELVLYGEGKLIHELSDTTKLSANLGAGYDFLAKQSSLTAAFAGGGGQFITNGLNVAPWSLRGGLGVVSTSKKMEITARYDVEFREGSRNQTVSVKFRFPF